MPLESLHSEFFGKHYGRFMKIAHDKLELYTVLFKLNFRSRVVVGVFCTINKSVVRISKPLILGFHVSI